MRIEIVTRSYEKGKDQLTLINAVTRKHIASLNPHDNFFTSARIQEAVNMYDDLLRMGLLKPVLAAMEKRQAELDKIDQP